MRVVLSNKQYVMLRLILQRKGFSRQEAGEYLQTTYTSMVKRGYLVYNGEEEEGFKITPLARGAMAAFENADVSRANISERLSQFLESYVARSARNVRRRAANTDG